MPTHLLFAPSTTIEVTASLPNNNSTFPSWIILIGWESKFPLLNKADELLNTDIPDPVPTQILPSLSSAIENTAFDCKLPFPAWFINNLEL